MWARAAMCLLIMLPIAANAQGRGAPPEGAKARAALTPLAKLVGEWEGDAKAVVGPGQTISVRQHEWVDFGAGSTVLIVRGQGRSLEPANKNDIVYEAAAMIWYDDQSGKLKMRAHRAEGMGVEPEMELKTDTLVWGFPVPGGRIRFTIAYGNNEWHEIGHFLREGAPPITTIEMRLKKVK